jgi:hypothetical protein
VDGLIAKEMPAEQVLQDQDVLEDVPVTATARMAMQLHHRSVNQPRVERGSATNRPQKQEDGKSEERDADHDTYHASVGEDRDHGADRCC